MRSRDREIHKYPNLFFRLLSCLLCFLLVFELVPLNAFAAIDRADQEEFQLQPILVSQGILNSNAEEAKSITHAYFDGADLPKIQTGGLGPSSVLPVAAPSVPVSTKGPAEDQLCEAVGQTPNCINADDARSRQYYSQITGLPHPGDPDYYNRMMNRGNSQEPESSSGQGQSQGSG
ncbi:MAG: hypothetical protein HY747_00115, partial [Elusimicrobia bacterium]|nr:hypothetical protein [Elusimicrobiota bacterium]